LGFRVFFCFSVLVAQQCRFSWCWMDGWMDGGSSRRGSDPVFLFRKTNSLAAAGVGRRRPVRNRDTTCTSSLLTRIQGLPCIYCTYLSTHDGSIAITYSFPISFLPTAAGHPIALFPAALPDQSLSALVATGRLIQRVRSQESSISRQSPAKDLIHTLSSRPNLLADGDDRHG